jgi:hypothetical protein
MKKPPRSRKRSGPPSREVKAVGDAPPRVRTQAISNAVVEPPFIDDPDIINSPVAETKAVQHEEVLSRIAVLERLMAELQRPGIGHNRSPEPIEGIPHAVLFGEEEVKETTKAIAILKAQPVVPNTPDEALADTAEDRRTACSIPRYFTFRSSEVGRK